jgi:Ser/Thr protein kinase RdoA (MazF antagonist)
MPPFPSPVPTERDQLDRAVLDRFPAVKPKSEVQFLHNHGGFSGARLWRVEAADGWICLRAWPLLPSLENYLPNVHHLMERARAAGLSFVPSVYHAARGETYVQHADRFWDLTMWMPGLADFLDAPSPHRLGQACKAVARLHQAWQPATTQRVPCPATRRRLLKHSEWTTLVASGWRPATSHDPGDPCAESAERAWCLLDQWMPRIALILATWAERAVSVQPCHCDLWHDHVLYDKDDIVGLLDYGSVKTDHVAVDLARLLGSMAGDDQDLWTAGIAGYRAVRSLSAEEETLAHVLDRTGTVLALANWLKWLYKEKRAFPDRRAVARRLTDFVNRVEKWE